MVDTSLRCNESFESASPPSSNLDYQDLMPRFSKAYNDRGILNDHRVLKNMLALEPFYIPGTEHYHHLQDEIKPHMRKIVVGWMLEVCVDQRSHTDVFLLSVNIMDRFLDTIKLKKNQFQLLGAASIFLASKMIEPTPSTAMALVQYTDNSYERDELLSMELLILSKLKWDLTAITAYDYIDHLLTLLNSPNNTASTNQSHESNNLLGSERMISLRKQTEKLVIMCATDPNFMTLPPSRVASASLASAVQQDHVSQPITSLSLQNVLEKLQKHTQIELDCLQQCIQQIEDLLLSCAEDVQMETPLDPNTSMSSSDGYFSGSSPDRFAKTTSSHSQKNDKSADSKGQQSDTNTPKEVFSISAFCVA